MKKEADIEKKLIEQTARVGAKKQKKKNVMSLDQFNDLISASEESKGIIFWLLVLFFKILQ